MMIYSAANVTINREYLLAIITLVTFKILVYQLITNVYDLFILVH